MWLRRMLVGTIFAGVLLPIVLAQTTGPFNEREVKKQVNVLDVSLGGKIWMLDFRFKDPRLLVVNVPGRGKKVVWYMWYQIINKTEEPHYFIPDFELVTLDKNTVHHDQVLPYAEEAIKRIEDPTGYYDIKNSVSIAKMPIPVTKPDSAPRAVTGVAVWDDVFQDLPDTTRFSIYVSGLSNGWSKDDNGTVRRKTLQLNFRRLSDRYHLDAEVKFVSPSEWVYRATPFKLPDEEKKVEAKKEEEKKDEAKKDEKKDEAKKEADKKD